MCREGKEGRFANNKNKNKMGCINSKKDLSDISPNIYRVVNVNEEGIALWSGQLEITPKELVLYRKGKEPTRWSLQHLRRYGFDADIFTFEAGRRCTTGEGIYAFKCRRAESLFHTLQSYIHGIALSDDSGHQVGDFVSSNSSSNGPINQNRSSRPVVSCVRQTGLGSQQSGNYVIPSNRPNSAGSNGIVSMVNSSRSVDVLSTESNYLEPTPLRGNSTGSRHPAGIRLSSVGSGPLSPEPNSPGSPNSFTIILEVTQLNQHQNTYQNSNVYQEFPIRSSENNNNLLNKKLSLDIPPQEPAPAIAAVQHIGVAVDGYSPKVSPTENDPSHMYVNVTPGEFEGILRSGTPTVNSISQANSFAFPKLSSTYSIDPTTRCYENLELGDFRPLANRTRHSKPDIFAKVDLPTHGLPGASDKSEPATPISKKEHRKVNYIELDLDQSPSSNSIVTSGSSANSLMTITTSASSNSTSTTVQSSVNNNNNNNIVKVTTPTITTGPNLLPPESPKKAAGGYAEIDFNKTVALSNTTASLELDSEGSRKTRHSSTATARQSNSVSD